ncbi:MAG TPA: NmrA family NAD(P)-binding protein [Polyangia bacterium]|jgi:uncharacterized protein YbjT (DUF2867 family)|nr:NmrA family NAD(P)-binding protein [Polyangia bacterium]
MFVISGASGNTGGAAAKALLAQGHAVRVIVRDAKKGEPWKQLGAEVAVAELDDAAALTAALRGADGVYAMLPPNHHADDLLALQATFITSWTAALAAAKPKHVVLLSSVGAELPGGTGPITAIHRLEAALAPLHLPLTAVRAAYFMENWGAVAHPAKADGVLPSMLPLGRPVQMVATADIGRTVAEALVAGPAAGKVIELVGPREYTAEDVAAAFGRVLGRPIKLIAVPEAGIEPALLQSGMKPKMAALYREMIAAFRNGKLTFAEPRRGRVELEEVVRGIVG